MLMNKKYYSFGNPFKVQNRRHICYKCETPLSIIRHNKIVSKKSEEAKYYDFSIGADGGVMIGPCEFIHNVFYCPHCKENIEFVTQLSFEDIDILIEKIEKIYKVKNISLSINKKFETISHEITERVSSINNIENICLSINVNDREIAILKIPRLRKEHWERPYYFKITKREIDKFIKKNLK